MPFNIYPTSDDIDIMLLAEGTYPFIFGGVSSWLHNLITNLPEYRFGVVFLGGTPDDYKGIMYELPFNLVHLEAHYLFYHDQIVQPESQTINQDNFLRLCNFHQLLKSDDNSVFSKLGKELYALLSDKNHVTLKQFLYSEESWQYIVHTYNEQCFDISFLEYFWTIRNLHIPLWRLTNLIHAIPLARMYHTVSTGFAGFLGALLHQRFNAPFILTEHGLYTKERKIDLLQNQWVAVGQHAEVREAKTNQYISQLWNHFFQVLAKFCYTSANPVISLFSDYHQYQIESGAPEENSIIVPNGVMVDENLKLKTRPNVEAPVVALIARVVPIKDIKTFINTIFIVKKHIPGLVSWIVGPTDESPDYVNECKKLVEILNLENTITFTGMVDVKQILPDIDLIVLSSISEGMPLVVLEGFAAGIPVVATDVGACRELIEGGLPEDKSFGKSGLIVNIGDSKALSAAIIELLTDSQKWQDAQLAARKRVIRCYSHEKLIDRYREIYGLYK